MSSKKQHNNPLDGVNAKTMITELVNFYGWDILYAALRLKCFQMNPTIPDCLTFLQKTEWARNKVESFYLHRFKRMPKAHADQFDVKPRELSFSQGIVPGDPMPLTIETIKEMQAQAEENYKAARRSRSRDTR
ncbi:MAG: VF530 family DNA-binding protein [Desulfoplanes sp.]